MCLCLIKPHCDGVSSAGASTRETEASFSTAFETAFALLCGKARLGTARACAWCAVRARVCVCVACAGGEGGREGGGSRAETDEGGMGQETGSTHSFGWLVGVVVSSSSSNRQLVRTTLPATEPVRRLRRSKLLRMLFVMAVAVFTDGATPGTCVHACEQAQRQCGAALRST